MKLKIIDVSAFQGKIDWEKVKGQIDGAILRCGYGGDYPGQQDEQFERNAQECTRLGIPFGVYHYSYADTKEKAEGEAAHILRLIKPYKLSFPVYLDVEEEKDSTRSFAKSACRIVGEKIEAAGYWFGVYANLNWWRNYLTGLDEYTKWVAQYNESCDYSGHDMWQYTSGGKISGISGNVDLNECYRDFPAILGGGTQNAQPEESFAPYKVQVTAESGLNLRKGPGTEYGVIRTLSKGALATVTKEENGWGHLFDGWISLDYVKDLGKFQAYRARVTAASGLNYREGPRTEYRLLDAYPYGTELTIVQEQEGWGKTDTGAWVCLNYVKKL